MTFFRIDPTATCVLRHEGLDSPVVVVEYADRGTHTRVAVMKSGELWRALRGVLPAAPLLRADALPAGLVSWVEGHAISTVNCPLFALPSAWMELNAHLLRHGALNG